MISICPCGSKQAFMHCCGRFIQTTEAPHNAEQLMRSRYSAYVLGNFDYIWQTYSQDKRADLSVEQLTEHAEQVKWLSLKVESFVEQQRHAEVRFCAYSQENKQFYRLHEHSYFVLEDDQWCYSHGDILVDSGLVKLGRNDTCLCGSGKKYKKCCGR